jgi:hypothetical protein
MDTIAASSTQFWSCKYGRVELLTQDNYPQWSTTLRNFLIADRTWRTVEGSETRPDAPPSGSSSSTAVRQTRSQPGNSLEEPTPDALKEYNQRVEDYETKAAKACSMIISSVSPAFQQYVLAKTNPSDMWNTLKIRLDTMDSNSGPFILRNQFFKDFYALRPGQSRKCLTTT